MLHFLWAFALICAGRPWLCGAVPMQNQPRGVFSLLESVATGKLFTSKAYAQALAKYGAPVSEVLAAAAASDDGEVSANPESNDEEYLVAVQIGTPAQTLYLDLDTGSADLWVFSQNLPAADQSGHTIFDPGASSTFTNLTGYTWDVTYGDKNSASGTVGTDTVIIGGTTVSNQTVELASSISNPEAPDFANDGFLGLAFSSLNTVRPISQSTFFANAMSSLSAPVFTANLHRGRPGTYDFGYIDSTNYNSSITYTPVVEPPGYADCGYWGFEATSYAVGTSTTMDVALPGIADTGTTLLLLPDSVVTEYYSQIEGAYLSSAVGAYVFPCSAVVPDFTFVVSGTYDAVVPGTSINYAPISSTECYGGIQSNGGVGFSIFGDVMFKSQFVVFDAGNNQIGFAPQSGS